MQKNKIKNIGSILFFCLTFGFNSNAQVTPADSPIRIRCTIEKRISGDFKFINTDASGNLYALRTSGQLIKYNSKGDSVCAFNDIKRFGKPNFVDAFNPMRVRLFFKDLGYLVTLDQLLTFRGSINLREKGFNNITAIAHAYDNNLWIYDNREYKLKKIDEYGKLLFETDDLRLLTETSPDADFILQNDEEVLLCDPNTGMYRFNYYGRYINQLHFPNWHLPKLNKGLLTGSTGNMLYSYEFQQFKTSYFILEHADQEAEQILVFGNTIYIRNKSGISICNKY